MKNTQVTIEVKTITIADLLCKFAFGQIECIQMHLGQSQTRESKKCSNQGAEQGQDQLEGEFRYGTPVKEGTHSEILLQFHES